MYIKGKICTVREKKNNQKVYIAPKIIHANCKIENTYKINTDTYQPKL